IAQLEAAANRSRLGSRVVAPFEVVDRNGRLLFDVDTESDAVRAQLYNAGGDGVTTMWATKAGGQFVARAGASGLATYLRTLSGKTRAGLQVLEDGQPRISLGKDSASTRYLLKIFGKGEKAVAAIGENSVGTGTAQVADADGQVKAILTVADNKGRAAIYNP